MTPHQKPFFKHVSSLLVAAMFFGSATSYGSVRTYTSPSLPGKLADGFDYPVGNGEAIGYYRSRGMTPYYHLGDDWNGNGGGNSDLGDPIHSIADGLVVYSYNYGSTWGQVIIIRHKYLDKSGKIDHVDSLYGHVINRRVKVGDRVRRGQQIAQIGTNNGMYVAHLHLEIRKNINIGIQSWNYSKGYSNYHQPSSFIEAHRPSNSSDRRLRTLLAESKAGRSSLSKSGRPSTWSVAVAANASSNQFFSFLGDKKDAEEQSASSSERETTSRIGRTPAPEPVKTQLTASNSSPTKKISIEPRTSPASSRSSSLIGRSTASRQPTRTAVTQTNTRKGTGLFAGLIRLGPTTTTEIDRSKSSSQPGLRAAVSRTTSKRMTSASPRQRNSSGNVGFRSLFKKRNR